MESLLQSTSLTPIKTTSKGGSRTVLLTKIPEAMGVLHSVIRCGWENNQNNNNNTQQHTTS